MEFLLNVSPELQPLPQDRRNSLGMNSGNNSDPCDPHMVGAQWRMRTPYSSTSTESPMDGPSRANSVSNDSLGTNPPTAASDAGDAMNDEQSEVPSERDGLPKITPVVKDGFEPHGANRAVIEYIKKYYKKPIISYKEAPLEVREVWFNEFKKKYRWSPEHDAAIRRNFDVKASERLSNALYDVRTGLAEGEADFYGILSEIVEIEYPNLPIKKVILFKCEWFDPKPNIGTRVLPEYSIVEVRQNRRYQKYDPFIIAQNASQVYYLPYPRGAKDKSNWSAVINVRSRGTFDDQYKLNTAFQQEVILTGIIGHAEYEEDQENLHEPNEMEEVDGNSLFEGIDEHINDNNDIDSESELEAKTNCPRANVECLSILGSSRGKGRAISNEALHERNA
nr:TdcA1-ORF2 protein [Ipomoea batatas]